MFQKELREVIDQLLRTVNITSKIHFLQALKNEDGSRQKIWSHDE
jgi:hypothetical protein